MSAYTAVIVEPRKHPALEFVLQNFVANLSNEWNILIFHGNENGEFVKDILATLPSSRFLKPIQLDVSNLTMVQYNAILMSTAFYKCIPTETFLIFQTDTLILEPKNLKSFLSYDYVGAPWPSKHVGNGGLSLRKKSKMIMITQHVIPCQVNEDIYFSIQRVIPLNKPTFEDAQQFAVETVFYDTPFGIHAPWKHLPMHEMRILLEKYPNILGLMALQ